MLTPERTKIKPLLWILSLIVFFTCSACEDSSITFEKHYLVRVGNKIFTVSDFTRALETAKTGYMNENGLDPGDLHEIRLQLLNEMIEELIIANRADELGISIPDQTLENEVRKFQKDYPGDTFEETLLENAVSLSFWKERLRKKLLKERVIHEELEKNITATSQEIESFYENYFGETFSEPEDEAGAIVFSQKIIGLLYEEKAKALYPEWIQSLWNQYGVEINEKAWNKITGS